MFSLLRDCLPSLFWSCEDHLLHWVPVPPCSCRKGVLKWLSGMQLVSTLWLTSILREPYPFVLFTLICHYCQCLHMHCKISSLCHHQAYSKSRTISCRATSSMSSSFLLAFANVVVLSALRPRSGLLLLTCGLSIWMGFPLSLFCPWKQYCWAQ